MKIEIKKSTLRDDLIEIIFNEKRVLICETMFSDATALGRTVLLEYNKQMPLNQLLFDKYKSELKPFIGNKYYPSNNLRVLTGITNTGNIVKISVFKYFRGIQGGGFVLTDVCENIDIKAVVKRIIKVSELN